MEKNRFDTGDIKIEDCIKAAVLLINVKRNGSYKKVVSDLLEQNNYKSVFNIFALPCFCRDLFLRKKKFLGTFY